MWRRGGHGRSEGPFSLAATDRTTWLSAISALKEAGFSANKLSRDTVIDALVEASGIVLPNSALGSEDYSNMIVAVATVIPSNDFSLCTRGCDVIDRIVRAAEVTLNARHVDSVLGWLLKVIQNASSGHATAPGSTPLSATAAALEQRSLVACALRCVGCIVYENADRCSRWWDPLTRVLLGAMVPPAPVSLAPQPVTAGTAGTGAAQTGSVAGLDATASGLTFVAAADDTLSAALVVAGNILLKAGGKVRDKHEVLFAALVKVLVWGSSLPARSLPAVEHAGRVLSAALRALQAILQMGVGHTAAGSSALGSAGAGAGSGAPSGGAGIGAGDRRALAEALQRSSEDLLRVLHRLSTFGWECPALKPPGAGAAPGSNSKRRRETSAPPVPGTTTPAGGAVAEGDWTTATGSGSASRRSSVGASRRRSLHSPARTPDRPGAGAGVGSGPSTPSRPGALPAALEEAEGEGSDKGSVVSASTRSHHSEARAARWQEGGRGGAGGRSGASWYTDSDDEEGGEGQDGDADGDGDAASQSQGMSFGLGGGAARRKRVPIRVRVTALHCIVAVARSQPRLVHSRWALFIPQVEGTSPKPFTPSLLTVMLYDPSRRVQEAAAGALAAVVDDAPLSRWVALPERHEAVTALAHAGAKGGAGGLAGTPPKQGTRTGAASMGRRTVASLSDKTCAMLGELHAALRRALATVDTARSPSLMAALLRASAALLAITPYDRLAAPSGRPRAVPLCAPLCSRAVQLLDCPSGAVSLAALHAISAAFSNPSAVADTAEAAPTALASPVTSRLGPSQEAATGSGATTPGAPPAAPLASDMLASLIGHCRSTAAGGSAGVGAAGGTGVSTSVTSPGGAGSQAANAIGGASFSAAILRAEVLVVVARAAKHRAGLVTACWPQLSPLLVECFGDASPAVRRAALQVVEELLHARAVAMAAGALLGGRGAGEDGEDGEGGLGDEGGEEQHRTTGKGPGAAGRPSSADGVTGPDGAPSSSSSSSLAEWSALEAPAGSGTGSGTTLTIKALLTTYLRLGMRDVAPNVRAGAAMAISYTLPQDWLHTIATPTDAGVQLAASGIGMTTATAMAAAAAAGSRYAVRDELLALLASAVFDPAPPVRAAAGRAWGAFLAYTEWRTSRPFSGLAARVLLGALNDDNVSVRAKASWALGNLCAPLATPAANAAGLTQPARPGSGAAGAKPAPAHLPGSAEIPDPAFTLYPAPGESLAPAAPLSLLPPQCKPVQAAVEAAVDASAVLDGGSAGAPSGSGAGKAGSGSNGNNTPVLAPLEQAFPGASPSLLVSLLGLPLLRVVTAAALRASADNDKVACTAVRTLGYCVQGLLTHWLPLPPSMRELVNPVVLQQPRGGTAGPSSTGTASNALSVRADPLPCPDDALLKAAMLALADIIAGSGDTRKSGTGDGGAAAAVGSSNKARSAPLPSQNWVDVGDDEDVREVIARRLQAPGMLRQQAKMAAEAEAEGGGDGEDADGEGSKDVTSLAPPAPTSTAPVPTPVPAPEPAAPPAAPVTTNRFQFSARDKENKDKEGGKGGRTWGSKDKEKSKPTAADTAMSWRRGPAPAPAPAATAVPSSGSQVSASDVDHAKKGEQGKAGDKEKEREKPKEKASLIAVKVRWNACHAVAQIVPLAHTCVMTHPEEHRARPVDPADAATCVDVTAGDASAIGDKSSAGGMSTNGGAPYGSSSQPSGPLSPQTLASLQGLQGTSTLSIPSPPRPKVRKEVSSGSATMWAGVDHISTANSPFLPKTLQGSLPPTHSPAIGAGAGMGSMGSPGGFTGTDSGAGSSSSLQQQSGMSSPSPLSGPTAANALGASAGSGPVTPERPAAAGGAGAQGGSTGAAPGSAAARVRQVVTDPTLPSVTIGVTWVPPILAALQLALAGCDNFKVRIASAHALGAVPSRDAYSIPIANQGLRAGGAPNPSMGLPFSSPAGHMSPALQRPGFDAYPSALGGLTTALASSEAPLDFLEYKYKDALKGAIRTALARTILLAERADYGRMKSWFDGGSAGLLADWLQAEEAVLPEGSAQPVPAEDMLTPPPKPAMDPGSPTRSVEDTPVRPSLVPPFGALAPHSGVDAALVRACWLKLAALFKSRVKTLPSQEVLRRFESKAAYWQAVAGAESAAAAR